MTDLSREEIRALARAAGLEIADEDLAEVGHVLNGILEAMAEIEVPGVEAAEPLPINLPWEAS